MDVGSGRLPVTSRPDGRTHARTTIILVLNLLTYKTSKLCVHACTQLCMGAHMRVQLANGCMHTVYTHVQLSLKGQESYIGPGDKAIDSCSHS